MSAHRSPRAPRRLIACGALALTLVLVAGACSDEDEGDVVADVLEDDELPTQPATPESTTTVPQICEPETPTEVTAEDKPEAPGETAVPEELVIDTITEGEGREVAAGDSIQIQYSGFLVSDRSEFDTSWDDLTPLPVTVGTGGVIPGFDQGLVGMKVGERRQLTIPAADAYGEQEQEGIPANSDLIFIIDLVQVCYPDPDAPTTTTTAPEGDGSTTTVAEGETTTTAAAEGETTTTAAAEGDGTTTTAPAPAEGDETTTTAAS